MRTENLSYVYGVGTPFEIRALSDVSISIEKGELVGIIGHTGSGKSTLVQHLNGLLKPQSGRIFLDEKDIWDKETNIRSVRFKVGLCFQYPEYQLFKDTVYNDIAFGPTNMGLGKDEIDKHVKDAARFIGLKPELLPKSPFDLSGGEKRRAAIAGVIAMNPEVLILDEPTAGLDPKGRDTVLGLVREYQQEMKNTVLIVSHSMEDIAKIAHRVLVMNKSKVAMFDTVENVYSRSEELIKMGLNVPEITQIFMGLKKKGLDVRQNIYTIEQGRQEIMRLASKGGKADD